MFNDPSDEKFTAYKATLLQVDDYYIVEGDIALTEQELRVYVNDIYAQKKKEKETHTQVGPELLLNTYNGTEDFYKDPSQRHLTYAVDKSSFTDAQYREVVSDIETAEKEWENACPACLVNFEHLSMYDSAPSFDKVNFIVRPYDFHGRFVAYSFFPHDAPIRRYLSIDPSFFSSQLKFSRAGIIRHELGHVLGYRHEHIRAIADCYQSEDNQWVPLTPYDRLSVMHYFCPNGHAGTLDLHLSALDIQGHRKLYGLQH